MTRDTIKGYSKTLTLCEQEPFLSNRPEEHTMDEQRQKKPLHQVHACQRYQRDKPTLVGSYIYASVQTGLELATSRIRAPILT